MEKRFSWIPVCHVKSLGKLYSTVSVSARHSHFQNSWNFNRFQIPIEYSLTFLPWHTGLHDLVLTYCFHRLISHQVLTHPPPAHNAPGKLTCCLLPRCTMTMLLYLARWWFLSPKWLSHLLPCQGSRSKFHLLWEVFSWLLGRTNVPFLFASMALCACLCNKT